MFDNPNGSRDTIFSANAFTQGGCARLRLLVRDRMGDRCG
jgi:hypothetical protein